ncbi:MAG: ABC transporter substrate-binding protein [Streptosporangiales bacterium]|nr:ABC transporter substrate-binding protein [Streptosporangiales bacterium]
MPLPAPTTNAVRPSSRNRSVNSPISSPPGSSNPRQRRIARPLEPGLEPGLVASPCSVPHRDDKEQDMNRRTLAAALTAATVALAASCGGAPEVPGVDDQNTEGGGGGLKLGLLLPYTGQYSWVGENVEEAVRPLVEQINEAGGIGGQKITLVRGDTEGTVDAGVLAARKLANVDRVAAFIGPTSLSFAGVRQVVVDTGTPMISPTAGTVELDQAGKQLFHRTVPSDSLGGRAIARALTQPGSYLGGRPYKRVALMVGDAPALVSFRDPIEQAMRDYGTTLATTVSYNVDKASYRSEVGRVLRQNPDMIILVGQPADSAKIMRQARESGYGGGWFVTQDQTNADYVELAGADVVEGVYGLQEAEAAPNLRDQFAETIDEELDIFQANSYDAINVTALAMYAAQKAEGRVTRELIDTHVVEVANPEDGDTVVTGFEDGKKAIDAGEGLDYQGLSGPVDFDDYGNITSPLTIMQVRDGKFAEAATIEADALR